MVSGIFLLHWIRMLCSVPDLTWTTYHIVFPPHRRWPDDFHHLTTASISYLISVIVFDLLSCFAEILCTYTQKFSAFSTLTLPSGNDRSARSLPRSLSYVQIQLCFPHPVRAASLQTTHRPSQSDVRYGSGHFLYPACLFHP